MRRLVVLALVVPALAACGWSPFPVVGSGRVHVSTTVTLIPTPVVRACGEVGVGIGWRLSVSAMSCRAGEKLVRAYFRGTNTDKVRTVLGYTCIAGASHVVCERHLASAEFVANH